MVEHSAVLSTCIKQLSVLITLGLLLSDHLRQVLLYLKMNGFLDESLKINCALKITEKTS